MARRHGSNLISSILPARIGVKKAKVPWLPTNLGANLLIWSDAGDLSNAAVSSWAAKVGTCTLAQATGANQPTKAAASFNSAYPGVTFVTTAHNDTANGDFLETTTQGSIPVSTTPSMLWIVCSGQAEADARIPLAVVGSLAHRRLVQNANESMTVHDNVNNVSNSVASSLVGNHILCGSFGATELRGYLDGVAFAANPVAATLDTGTFTRLRMAAGALTTPANIENTVVAHMLMTTVLIESDRQKLEGYLAHKVGLTANLVAGHPYRNIAP